MQSTYEDNKVIESDTMYSSQKGHETQRGLLNMETMRTDRSNNQIEMTDLSLREPYSSSFRPDSNSPKALTMKNKKFIRPNQNQSDRSA